MTMFTSFGIVGTVLLAASAVTTFARAGDPLMQPPPGNPVAPLVRRAAVTPKSPVEKPPAGQTPATRFKRSGSRIFLPKFVARIAKTDAQKKTLTEVLEDGLQTYEKDAAESGVANDVAAAATFFLTTQWSVCNNGKPTSETSRLLTVVRLQRAMDGPELQKATDAQKQEFYEWCVCTGALISLTAQVADEGKDAAMTARLKQSATEGIQNLLAVDPARISFTGNGMEIEAVAGDDKK